LWHDSEDLGDVDAVILPGGFAYGDYLRCGAIAKFSPVMRSVRRFAAEGGLVLGICNGFQILVEAGLLPGALIRNRGLRFVCRDVHLRTETSRSPFTCAAQRGEILRLPVAHGEGCYYADERTLDELEAEDRVAFRYLDNPNGSLRDIAGVLNRERNVMGLMPHPERASEALLGSADGLTVLHSMLQSRLVRA
jgi:phosphoribosylformylglycinamidine synthase